MTAGESTARNSPSSPHKRQGHQLRSEEEIRASHTPEASDLLVAVRRLIVDRFGEQSPLASFAAAICQFEGPQPRGGRRRSIAKSLSEQMSKRAVNGPKWEMIAHVLQHCVGDVDRGHEQDRLTSLYQATRGAAPPCSDPPSGTQGISLEALDCQIATLNTRIVELRCALEAAHEREQDLIRQRTIDRQQTKREVSRLTAEVMELRQRHARLIARAEADNLDLAAALPSSAQPLLLNIDHNAPSALRELAAYLRGLAELGNHSTEHIAASTGVNVEVVERALTAQELPPYPAMDLIGSVVGADSGLLFSAYMIAEEAMKAVSPPPPMNVTFKEIMEHYFGDPEYHPRHLANSTTPAAAVPDPSSSGRGGISDDEPTVELPILSLPVRGRASAPTDPPASHNLRRNQGSDIAVERWAPSSDLADVPPAEQHPTRVARFIAQLQTEVFVADGHPRYHLIRRCRYLIGHNVDELPVAEAVDDGFTPCGHCRPVSYLASQLSTTWRNRPIPADFPSMLSSDLRDGHPGCPAHTRWTGITGRGAPADG